MSSAQSSAPFLTRSEIRQLKKQVATAGNAEAAERLLVDSTRKGHDKLALHRYALLRRLDARRCQAFESYCQAAAAKIGTDQLQRILEHVDRALGGRSGCATSG